MGHGVRVLLLQARLPDDPMAQHEHACFVSRTGLPGESVVTHDLRDGPPSPARLRRHDALMVGGSGDYYVSLENLPRFEEFLDFLRDVIERGHPTFASCFGYQSIVRALGGRLIQDAERAEVGTFELTLSAEGRADNLFGVLPARFPAQLGHRDRVARMSDGALNLAASERTEFQALRIPNQPIWATQFHPELDRASNLQRFRHYTEYGPGRPEERAAAAARFTESPDASSLLTRFLALVFP